MVQQCIVKTAAAAAIAGCPARCTVYFACFRAATQAPALQSKPYANLFHVTKES
jgi:hypothetical protein